MRFAQRIGILVLGMAPLAWAEEPVAEAPPVIKHSPVLVAPSGQSISMRATVKDDSGRPASVNLYYTASRDAAPFKISMSEAGAGSYIGTIQAGLLEGLSGIFYYIEAIDRSGAAAETAWYQVRIGPGEGKAPGDRTPAAPPRWKMPALIGAGGAIAGGTALALSGGGSSGGSGGTNVAVYSGSATVCLQLSGQAPECDSYPAEITVDSSGRVVSDTLYRSATLEGQVTQNTFLLTAPVSTTNLTGQIEFLGTVLGSRIVGTVQGTVQSTATGAAGVYYGNFSAVKR